MEQAGASADGPVTNEIRPAEFHVWLEGVTADDKTIIGGFKTLSVENNGLPLDNLFARVTILEYLSGATPTPELVNRTPGTLPDVRAELDIAFPGDTFDTNEITHVVFEVQLPSIELFRADVSFLTVN